MRGLDPKLDLALIKIEAGKQLPVAKLGDSDKLLVSAEFHDLTQIKPTAPSGTVFAVLAGSWTAGKLDFKLSSNWDNLDVLGGADANNLFRDDLQTLQVVPERLAELAPQLPRDRARVAESGLNTATDCERVVRAGYDMALIGGALMSAPAPESLLRAMLAAGREAA